LLLTRPEAQSLGFAEAVETALPGRFRPVVAPLIDIAFRRGEIDLGGAEALLFTSANGVAAFAAVSPRRDLPALCVGEMTAEAARGIGFEARAAGGDVTDLFRLARAAHRPGGGVLVHVRGRHAAGDLVGWLAADGVPARAAELYDQRALPIAGEAADLLAAGAVAAAAFFSPRTARLFAEQARAARWPLAGAAAVALSPAVDAALEGLGFGRRLIAARPARTAMTAVLAEV
jgi:uroporphyrinogen-III synthase